jgi:hypothetical protein
VRIFRALFLRSKFLSGAFMKLVFATLLVLASINALAAQTPSKTCQAAVLKRATKIKSDAKAITRGVEDQLDAGLDREGDPTIGMGTRDMSRGADAILNAVRELQQIETGAKLSDSSKEWILQLCNNKLDTDTAVENY